jgi:hypothetical protein
LYTINLKLEVEIGECPWACAVISFEIGVSPSGKGRGYPEVPDCECVKYNQCGGLKPNPNKWGGGGAQGTCDFRGNRGDWAWTIWTDWTGNNAFYDFKVTLDVLGLRTVGGSIFRDQFEIPGLDLLKSTALIKKVCWVSMPTGCSPNAWNAQYVSAKYSGGISADSYLQTLDECEARTAYYKSRCSKSDILTFQVDAPGACWMHLPTGCPNQPGVFPPASNVAPPPIRIGIHSVGYCAGLAPQFNTVCGVSNIISAVL